MALVKRGSLPHPALAEETVAVEPLGGEVLVRGMSLRERLAFAVRARTGERTPSMEEDRETFENVSHVLSWCVLDADRERLMTPAQWEAWGSAHTADAMRLFGIAKRLSLMATEDVEKKSATALN